jgi:hypothetical protein
VIRLFSTKTNMRSKENGGVHGSETNHMTKSSQSPCLGRRVATGAPGAGVFELEAPSTCPERRMSADGLRQERAVIGVRGALASRPTFGGRQSSWPAGAGVQASERRTSATVVRDGRAVPGVRKGWEVPGVHEGRPPTVSGLQQRASGGRGRPRREAPMASGELRAWRPVVKRRRSPRHPAASGLERHPTAGRRRSGREALVASGEQGAWRPGVPRRQRRSRRKKRNVHLAVRTYRVRGDSLTEGRGLIQKST